MLEKMNQPKTPLAVSMLERMPSVSFLQVAKIWLELHLVLYQHDPVAIMQSDPMNYDEAQIS